METKPCRVVLIPNPLPAEETITVGQPPPIGIVIPFSEDTGRLGYFNYRRVRCARADHTGVTEAVYRPA